ncbi:MAG TPA: hypothetical protein VNI83_04580 [Vicinamibacterales bacterium]|nr:hypothetical protein [Vicinamibacterales bacterium]
MGGDRLVLNAGPCYIRAGSGAPEGAVVGSQCDQYLDTSTGRLYRKMGGVNTTTDWREIVGYELSGALVPTSHVQSPTYASQTTGWRISSAGEADFRYLFVDEMHAKSLIADLELAGAGGQIIAKSVAMVSQTFSCPAAGGTATLWVRDLPSAANMAAFEANDWVVLRTFSRSGGALTIGDCVGQVSGYADGTGANEGQQSWTFTRGSGGSAGSMSSGTQVQPDALAIDYGISGNGYWEVNAIDGVYGANSPYAQVVTWTTAPVAANRTVRTRIGRLRGITGTDEYGLLAGTYAVTGGAYFRASNANFDISGITARWWSGTSNVITIAPGGGNPYIGIGNPAPSSYNSTGIFLGWSSGAARLSLVGSGGDRLTWDGTNLTTTGTIRGGQTDYDTGTGFWLGPHTGGVYKLSIGQGGGPARLTWDGSILRVGNAITIDGSGAISVSGWPTAGGNLLHDTDFTGNSMLPSTWVAESNCFTPRSGVWTNESDWSIKDRWSAFTNFESQTPGSVNCYQVIRSTRVVPVKPNARYEASAYLGQHRGVQAFVQVRYFDATGALVAVVDGSVTTAAGGNRLSQFGRSCLITTAPATAVTAQFWAVQLLCTTAGSCTDPYLFLVMPYFGEAGPSQTTCSDWSGGTIIHGASIRTGTITADRLAVNQLSAISANLGTVNAGTLNAVTINTPQINIPADDSNRISWANNAGIKAASGNLYITAPSGTLSLSGASAMFSRIEIYGEIATFGQFRMYDLTSTGDAGYPLVQGPADNYVRIKTDGLDGTQICPNGIGTLVLERGIVVGLSCL